MEAKSWDIRGRKVASGLLSVILTVLSSIFSTDLISCGRPEPAKYS
jgi:hypothetical protein